MGQPRSPDAKNRDLASRGITVVGALALALALALAGCGGGGHGPAATCGQVQPCGGALAGSWKVVATCANFAVLSAGASVLLGCAGIDLEVVQSAASGTLTFARDATYRTSLMVSGTLRATLPLACAQAKGIPLTCAEAAIALRIALAATPTVQAVTCASGATGCTCDFMVGGESSVESGTFSTSATEVDTAVTGETAVTRHYCVQGTTLHLMGVDRSVSLGPLGTFQLPLDEDLVATRQ
jgi:hypothetical protein